MSDDLISRLSEIRSEYNCFDENEEPYYRALSEAIKILSAQPDLDEWCTDCSEYDQERHCCPRWNRVIRQTLKDAQPERKRGKWIKKKGSLWTLATCSVCGELSVEGNKPFCSNCGSYNGGEEEGR